MFMSGTGIKVLSKLNEAMLQLYGLIVVKQLINFLFQSCSNFLGFGVSESVLPTRLLFLRVKDLISKKFPLTQPGFELGSSYPKADVLPIESSLFVKKERL